jgi:tRNA G10  N-methylase Trm11
MFDVSFTLLLKQADAIVTDPPWNRLAKAKSRLKPRRGRSDAAIPLGKDDPPDRPIRAPDTDHLHDSDIQKHCDLWYRLLADNGTVLLRLDWASRMKWVKALEQAKFIVMKKPHGCVEYPRTTQVFVCCVCGLTVFNCCFGCLLL